MRKLTAETRFNELTKVLGSYVKPVCVDMGIGANKTLPFEDSEMAKAYTVNANAKGYSFGEEDISERIFKSFIAATSVYLGKLKVSDPNVASALVLTDVGGEFKFAGIVEYHENEENPDEPGNWSYVLTFNEEDLKDLEATKEVKKNLYGDDAFKNILDKVAYDIGGIEFQHERYMYTCCTVLIDTIIQVLDHEAIANEQVDIELKGYATFSVSVENGEKVFACTPDGAMKALIKDDVALEK